MFRMCFAAHSRPQRQHFRKKIPGFYSAYYGASYMKHYPVVPYERKSSSLYHYPEISSVTGKKINWLYETPTSGLEGVTVYGPNTLELTGLPMGKTPEYLQERLRRFFSKFGVVTFCRALNHPLDPYQCDGKAYVSFRDSSACTEAGNSVLKLPHNRALTIRNLITEKTVHGSEIIRKWDEDRIALIETIRRVYFDLLSIPDGKDLKEFLEIENVLKSLSTIFIISESKIFAKRLISIENELGLFSLRLVRETKERLAVPWRATAPVPLPTYTQRRVALWDKKDSLPFDLEILSRDMRQHRVHDEKFLISERNKRTKRNTRRTENREK